MTEKYEKLDLIAGTAIEDAVKRLVECRKEGRLVCADFNNTMLYSDTVTMDGAYLAILGRTKAEQDAYMEARHRSHEQKKKEHQEKIPELTVFWETKGKAILSEDRHELWAKCVPLRLGDLYQGMELGNCLDIVEILNNGGTLEEAKEEISKQAHSNMSMSLVCSMVNSFAERGKEFADYLDA